MALEVAAIVKTAGHLDRAILAAAIKKKMAGPGYRSAAPPAPAEFQVIRPRALDHDLGPFFRAWPLGVGSDIEQRLPDEGTVAQRRGISEFQVIRPRALDHDLGPFFRAWPLGVGSDIEQRLPDEGTVAQRRGLSEFLEAPFHDGGYVAAGGPVT